MIKSRDKVPAFKGHVTAFLALLFILMLSLIGALVESASIQNTKNQKRADTLLALESTFAEYDRELLEQYDLFVRLGCTEDVLNHRLQYYGADQMSHSIKKQELLTDYQGRPFYEQAVRYAKDWLGVEENIADVEYDFSSDMTLQEEEEIVSDRLNTLLEEEEQGLPETNNPIASTQRLKNTSLLTLVAPNPEQLSNRSIKVNNLPSKRVLEKGNYSEAKEDNVGDKVFFAAYLGEHFGTMTEADESHTLLYEQEYLLGGYPSDKENLEKVCREILYLRMAVNYMYLLSDGTRQAEAEALALSLCTLLTVPGITEVVKQAILLAWAYGESIVDVRVLLKGKRVPLIKTTESWQLQLANLVKLGTEDEVVNEKDSPGGLSYENYLTGMLLLENTEALCMRSLDLIEGNLKKKMDECMTKVQIESQVGLRRGVKDTFTTSYGYQ